MSAPLRHVLHQGPVLAALAKTALGARHRRDSAHGEHSWPTLPGIALRRRVAPLPPDLVRDFIRHIGGDPSAYGNRVPHHFFPHWIVPLASETLESLPIPLHKIVNAGCRLEFRSPLHRHEAWSASAQLASVERTAERVRVQQRVTTSSGTADEALVATIRTQISLASARDRHGPRREPARVPVDAVEVARWRLRHDAGLDFAKLTGDFNPVHWVPTYARMMGFKGAILHGFATLARTIESLQRNVLAGSTQALETIDVEFRRPIVLPARVGVYVDADRVFVGVAPGGPASMTGTFALRSSGDQA